MTGPRSPTLTIYGTSPQGNDQFRHRGPAPWRAEHLSPIAVVIPTIPPRLHQLNRALKSIQRQTLQPALISIQVDDLHEGAPLTRNKALQRVDPSIEWVAFLDDDDYFGAEHLELCLEEAENLQADYVYPWFTIAGPSVDPFPQFFKRPWTNTAPHQTTIVTFVRRKLAQKMGFRTPPDGLQTPEGHRFGEDFQFTLDCMAAGAKIVHLPKRTWYWVVTGWNTSGQPEAWK